MRFSHKTALATAVAALVSLGAAIAQAEPPDDGQGDRDTMTDYPEPDRDTSDPDTKPVPN